MTETPNALTTINQELRQVEALAARKPLDQNDTGLYALIMNVRDALEKLAGGLENRVTQHPQPAGHRLLLSTGRSRPNPSTPSCSISLELRSDSSSAHAGKASRDHGADTHH